MSEAKPSVPDILREAMECLSRGKESLTQAIREVTWAYQDLVAQAQLPIESNEPKALENLEAIRSEIATRTVLPRHLPIVLEHVESAAALLVQLVQLVPPLVPKPTTEETHG